jgi:hypothetical protein
MRVRFVKEFFWIWFVLGEWIILHFSKEVLYYILVVYYTSEQRKNIKIRRDD